MAIETTALRNEKLKIILIGTSIIAIIGFGIIGENQLIEDNIIRGKAYTDNEYKQLKTEVISIIKNRKTKSPTFEEGEIWKEILSKECKNITLNDVIASQNLIDKLNEKLEKGCV